MANWQSAPIVGQEAAKWQNAPLIGGVPEQTTVPQQEQLPDTPANRKIIDIIRNQMGIQPTAKPKMTFTDYMLSSLPFGDEVGALGETLGRYLNESGDQVGREFTARDAAGMSPYDVFSGPTTQGPDIGGIYNDAKQGINAQREEYSAENPIRAGLGTAVGLAAFGPGKAAASFPTSLPAQMALTAKQGAIIGGAVGAGEGEGAFERLQNAASGAIFGGVTGAATPAVVAGASKAFAGAKRLASPVTSAITNRINPEMRAVEIAREALKADNVSMSDAASRLSSTPGSPRVLADIAGQNTRDLARVVANTTGSGREGMTKFIAERNLQQPDRILNAVKTVLKNPDDFASTTARLGAQRERIASPIYKEAFKNSKAVDVTRVVKYIDSKVSPGVTKMANPASDLAPDGITAQLIRMRKFFQTAKNQRVGLQPLHNVKMEIDNMISAAQRAGEGPRVRSLMGVQNELLRAMDRASPLYQKARGIYSSTHELDNALEVGLNSIRQPADALKAQIAKMSPAEKEMVQIGAARAIRDNIEKIRDGHDVVGRLFGSKAARDSIKAAFQNDQAFRKFQAELFREIQMRRTANAVTGNSTTAKQISDMMEFKSSAQGRDVLALLLEGEPVKAGRAAFRQILQGEKGIGEKVADRLSDMLLSNDPQKIVNAVKMLEKREAALEKLKAALMPANRFIATEVAGSGAKLIAP